MPVFRREVRSSNSTDFERTATLRDMEELAFGEEVADAINYRILEANVRTGAKSLRRPLVDVVGTWIAVTFDPRWKRWRYFLGVVGGLAQSKNEHTA